MGHLTRVMAIARKLPEGLKPIIMTMSKGLPTARRRLLHGILPVEGCRASTTVSGGSGSRHAHGMIEEHQPSVVAFDGIYPYMGLRNALSTPRTDSIWIRVRCGAPEGGAVHADLFDVLNREFAAA